MLGLVHRVESDYLDPVAIRVERKCNVMHSSIAQFLLKLVASIFDTLTRSLNMVHADADMTEPFSRLRIAIGHLKIVVLFGPMIVGQFQHSLTIGPFSPVIYRVRRVVS